MDVIYSLIPGMLFIGLAAVAVLFWAARSGQFEDLEGDGQRILLDEDEEVRDARCWPDAEDGELASEATRVRDTAHARSGLTQ